MPVPLVSESELATALKAAMRDSLPPVAMAGGVTYLVFAALHLLVMPPPAAFLLSALALVTAGLLFAAAAWFRRRLRSASWAHPAAAAIAALVLANVLTHLSLHQDPVNTAYLAIFLIAVGCFFFSLPWLVAALAAGVLGWTVIALAGSQPFADWFALSYEIVAAIAVSLVIYFVRLGSFAKFLQLRQHDERLHVQLEAKFEELRDAQRFNQQMANAAPYILYVFDLAERRNLFINSRICDLLGYSDDWVQRLNSHPLAPLVHPDDRVAQLALWSRVAGAPDGQVIEGEYRLQHADGSWRWFCCREVVFNRDPDGDVRCVLGTAHDVTERKQAEQILQAVTLGTSSVGSPRFFASLVRQLAVALDVKYVLVCEHADSSAPQAHVLAFWKGDCLEEEREHPLDGPCRGPADGRPTFISQNAQQEFPDCRFLRDLGVESYSGVPLFDSSGRILGHLAVMNDRRMEIDLFSQPMLQVFVSRVAAELERMRAEKALRASEERFRAIFENAAIGIGLLQLDEQMRIVQSNRAFERMLGYDEGRFAGTSILDITHPDDLPQNLGFLNELTVGNRLIRQFEKRFRRADGRIVWVRVHSSLLRQEPGRLPIAIGLIEDITEHKQAEAQIRRLTLELEHAGRLSVMGEMAASIAHELHQPLAVIVNYAQGCVRRVRKGTLDPDQLLRRLTEIADESIRAGEVINRIRAFLQKREQDRRPLDVNAVVGEALQLARFERHLQDVKIEFDAGDSLPKVTADNVQITQVILNLVLNGVQAMASAGTQNPALHIETRTDGEWVEISVADCGPGIPPDLHPRIFEQFFTTKSAGLGMGLAISRSIVETHGGRLWFSSPPGGGTTFRFTLPVASELAQKLDQANQNRAETEQANEQRPEVSSQRSAP